LRFSTICAACPSDVDFGIGKTAIGPPCGVGQCAIGDIGLYGIAEASDRGFEKDVELFDSRSTVYGSCLFIHLGYLHKTRVIRKAGRFLPLTHSFWA
jgi:hypothetical protein